MYKEEIKWLWNAWKGNRLQAFINASLGLIDVAIQMAQVWAVKHAIDVASHEIDGSVVWAVMIMAGLICCSYAVSVSSVWVRNLLGVKAQNRMQQKMLSRILRSEWEGKGQMHSGDVINRLETDVQQVVGFLTETLPSTLSVMTLFCCAFAYLASMDWKLACIIVVMLPLFILASKIYMRKMRKLNREVRDTDSEVQSILQETVQNRMLIKTQEKEDAMVDKLERTQSKLRRNVKQRTKFSVISRLTLNFGFSLTYIVAFLWSALRMSAGTLSFGGMTAFLQLVAKVQQPARNLTKLVPQFVMVFTAAERLMQLEKNPLEEQGEARKLNGKLGIKAENISFAYKDDEQQRMVIEDLSFDFKPATCNVILGETGSGKTTLLRLILALVHPTEGSVRIYNDETEEELSPLHRTNIVFVPQGNTLMSGSIRDNLMLGRMDATTEEMEKALNTACADFVFELPEGIDSEISEDGVGLSEGQAQRIAIARALLKEGAIMVFDEATSALDGDTEEQLLKNVLSEEQRTVIFVTHRKAVCKYSENILNLSRNE
ncbi:MAG: ABC transporter ATP-binding protein/permease [Bacteroidaceae bacterium]|nr:ABC transporter ATP-binding protein/permease [Bacteroidaceae bacterium]